MKAAIDSEQLERTRIIIQAKIVIIVFSVKVFSTLIKFKERKELAIYRVCIF
jgi:hypothetical protein